MVELLSMKCFIPSVRPDLVLRPRLNQQLLEGLSLQRKLTLVSAPAGFGKTTLVAAWLRETDQPAAWLSLDEADNDLPRFLSYLAAALQVVDEAMVAPLLSALQSPQLPAIEKVLTGLLNEIALRTDPLILVLDDYHLITEPAITDVIEFLLLHQPLQMHVVLTTREDPPLPTARLRARNQLTEIRAWDLRFTQEETAAFLRGVMGLELSQEDVAALEDRTEGWAAGLQLAGISMRKQTNVKAFIADFSGSNRHILDYLTEEVLRQQPQETRTFLLQTSVLDRLSGPLCDAVTGRTDSSDLLVHLEAANLFVIPLDEERRWYRYHHLFSDLLRSQLTRSQPDAIPELQRRASRWYEENGDIRAAIAHALLDKDLSLAARQIEQYAVPKLYQGEVSLVISWFDRLPETILSRAPMLCISKAWALALLQRNTRREEVERALSAANAALDRMNAEEELRNLVAGHAASIRAFLMQTLALWSEKPEELIALSQEANRLLPEDENGIRSVNALNTGYGYLALADFEAASRAFKQTLEEGLTGGNLYAAIYGPLNLVLIALLLGRLGEALQVCETNIERFNQVLAGENFPPIGALSILKGCILLEMDCLAEAEQALTEGLELIRWTGEYEAHSRGYTAKARLHAIQGDRLAVLETVKSLEEAWPEGAFYAQALRHSLLLRHWPEDPDVQKDAQRWLDGSGIEFDQLRVIDGIDPISEAHFDSYLEAAHVLAHLANENPGKHALEGVHAYLRRQKEFSETRGITGWSVVCAVAQVMLLRAAGKKHEALGTLDAALRVATPTGLFRIFVDECETFRPLIVDLKPNLKEEALIGYADHLLSAMSCEPERSRSQEGLIEPLSERELEVLHYLVEGLTYDEIGRQLYLSLNTVQFHVKNIYRKLLVNKRVQAIEKAREMKLI